MCAFFMCHSLNCMPVLTFTLGCYGFELEGKKYSTNYIADGKGYRLAPTDTDLITVYSKGSSEPRCV